MDMKKILENMDAAAEGKKPSTAQADVNDMKTILESIQSVEECGMAEMPQQMPAEPEEKVSMNVTLNARGDAVEELIALMGGAKTPQEAPVRMPMPTAHDHGSDDMKALMKLASDEEVDEAEGEWDNAPDEDYKDHEYMIKDLAGGLNKEKKSHPPTNGGDNPMALEQSIKEQLWAALNEKFSTEGRGRGRGKKAKEDIETTEGRGRGRGKKAKEDIETTEGRGRGKKGRGRGKG